MSIPEMEILTSQVSRIFRIVDVTAGNPKEWIVRYRGHLLNEDTVAAYDQLAEALLPYGITPLFRTESSEMQVILLTPSMVIPRMNSRIIINVILFILTILSVMLTG